MNMNRFFVRIKLHPAHFRIADVYSEAIPVIAKGFSLGFS